MLMEAAMSAPATNLSDLPLNEPKPPHLPDDYVCCGSGTWRAGNELVRAMFERLGVLGGA